MFFFWKLMTIQFFVPGIPKPGGSKKGFFNKHTGRVSIVDACAKSKDWKQSCAVFAREAYLGAPLAGPLIVKFQFQMLRPQGHRGKNGLKPSAPAVPTTRPDVLKLARSTEDAMTGIIWIDDAQTVNLSLSKVYSEQPGCWVKIETL